MKAPRQTETESGPRLIPGFVRLFSDIPGPCDEVLAQVGNDGVSTHHLGAKDVAENTVVVVEVDCEQLSLQRRQKNKKTADIRGDKCRG